ncbi:MAG: hypothetical protein GY953_16795 [bacterium]|nr:hypothetical protein [bacterium]
MSELADLLERFRRGPELVAVATTGAAGPQINFSPAPGKWSVRQIACHLADSEMVGAIRLRRVIAEENPELGDYDRDAWATKLGYAERKISHALESFRRTRAESHELVSGLPEAAFSRSGVHPARGSMTLLDLVRLYAEHAEKHARQIMSVREQYKESRPR